MNISRTARQLSRVVADSSPLILTTLGALGVAGTAFLTGRAAFRSVELIETEKARFGESKEGHTQFGEGFKNKETLLTKTETVQLLWKLYLPAVGAGAVTITCIIMANKISTSRLAALTAIAAMSRNDLQEYKEKLQEMAGGKKMAKDVKKSIAQDKVNQALCDADPDMTIQTGLGNTLFLDSYTLRTFRSSIEHVKRAENDILSQLLREGYATQSEWFDKLGIAHTVMSEEMGWDSDDKFEVEHVPTLIEEGPLKGQPCIFLVYDPNPRLRPWKSND